MLFTLLSVGPPLVGNGVFIGTDLMASLPPWKSDTQSVEVRENLWISDTIDSGMPQSELLVSSAKEGFFAQWNPYQAGGVEIGGLPNSGMFSPLSIPRWVLPLSYANAVIKVLEIVTITIGMALLLRRFRIPSAAWPIASVIYASSGFLVAWTNWQHTRVAALIPLLFWAVDRAVVGRRPRSAIPVGLVVGAMLLGGFPAVTAYALYGAGAFAVVRTLVGHRPWKDRICSLVIAITGVVLGFLLAAWQMVPFLYNATTVIDFDSRAQNSDSHLSLADLATSLVPSILGGSGNRDQWSPDLNPVENFSYLGVGALVLVGAAILSRPRDKPEKILFWFFGGAALLSLLLVYVGGPLLGLVQHLPIFSNNLIGRLRVMTGFFVAVLAAYGYGRIVSGSASVPAFWAGPLAARGTAAIRWMTVLVLAIAASVVVRRTLFLVPAEAIDDVRRSTVQIGALGVLLALAVLAALFVRSARVVVGVLAPIVVVIPALAVTTTWWARSASDTFYPVTGAHTFLEENLDGNRYTPVGQTALPGTNTFYKLRTLGGHAFHSPEWKELIIAADPSAFLSTTYSSISQENLASTVESPILDRLAVDYVVADPNSEILGAVDAGAAPESQATLDRDAPLQGSVESGPLRGVLLKSITQDREDLDGSTLQVRVVAEADGAVLAENETWAVHLSPNQWVALAGDQIPASMRWRIEVTVDDLDATGTVGVDAGGALAIDVVRPVDDAVRVVHTGDATIYERTGALDRVRWASEATVIEDEDARLRAMASGTYEASVVILEDEADASTGTGGEAVVTEIENDTNHVEAMVDAKGPGWVVVADSLQRGGWTATVDGKDTDLLPADHAAVAIPVDEGVHTVLLSYETPGLRTGVIVTGTTIMTLVICGLIAGVERRRRRSV
ncbi:DUF6044 family protein [Sanguibacter antarcticus]|uniref:Membrane protein YfhO n=1 Tax=Sanguibacter antarcticus TaxID=372484 RepID=A0A2A9E1J6_9MICO|nr:DUF6044 family protein [Sanguibacter antarcticus]PFG32516.1 membrane protein YfhO [Sanguibacter antarcticus]